MRHNFEKKYMNNYINNKLTLAFNDLSVY